MLVLLLLLLQIIIIVNIIIVIFFHKYKIGLVHMCGLPDAAPKHNKTSRDKIADVSNGLGALNV